jgi:hypothetical protein
MADNPRIEITQELLQRHHGMVKAFVDRCQIHPGIFIIVCAGMLGWDIALNHTEGDEPHLRGMFVGEREYIEGMLKMMGVLDEEHVIH